ncbi:Apolipoprotein N-acyltransferase [Aliiroseovarius sediminilitoris]|uniref:Apolipoprotein N-acyltransferase n=1 Tax=Aliiroseovarius sediminilitoris TaxID=1173584 RepID=A0A1I0NGI0_9RHOB|nr:apolipoprotein N-acyltransferase [Aliiroseovarius sediminilitoris]SEW00274.1 Apolipoprotein N-acyltransferase [Aliiroseovarius sediminilitoris]
MTKPSRLASVRAVIATSIMGAVAALGHAPFDWPIFTLIGLAAATYIILKGDRPKQAALRAWGLGIGYFGVTLSWLVEPFLVDAARYGWMAPFALLFMAAGLALLWAIAAGLSHRIAPTSLHWLSLALALTGAEMIRGWLFTGFPWGNPGHVWIETPFAQLAAYIGASGLGALTLFMAALMAKIVEQGQGLRARLILLTLGAVIAMGALTIGVSRGQKQLPADRDATLRLVQPNAPQHLKWDPRYAYDFVTRQIDFTAADPAPGQPRPDLVIWPETAVPTLLEWTDTLRVDIAEAAKGALVMFGVQRGDGLQYFNSLALVGPTGEVQATYDKHHLVPFGEYIPLGDWLEQFGISAFASRVGNGYSAGPGAQVLDVGVAGSVLPLICYEAVFPRDIRSAPERADWILHATNDAWFGDYSMPYQHLAQARYRAIEFGLPVIRVANTGVSAVIDPRGQLRATIPLGQAGFLDARLPGAEPPTPYSRYGDIPLAVLIIVALCGLFARRVVKAR